MLANIPKIAKNISKLLLKKENKYSQLIDFDSNINVILLDHYPFSIVIWNGKGEPPPESVICVEDMPESMKQHALERYLELFG